jgi:heme-degrading monooxygenase HmoA
MILEIADFTVRPETQDAFGAAMERGVQTIISKAAGYLRHEIQQCIETPGRFVLMIEWATLESHTVDFRGSAAFVAWREIVGPYFAQAPHVEHFRRLSGNRLAG